MSRPNATTSSDTRSDTASHVLDVAERLVQTRGFNAFSYADIAEEVGITTASLHYHFRTKADLGRSLIERYAQRFGAALETIEDSQAPSPDMLARYVHLYADVLNNERLCLCGMLAAEYTSLPVAMQDEIRTFFDMNEEWLAAVAEKGRSEDSLHFDGSSRDVARLILGTLEGAMLVARPYADVDRFEAAAKRLLLDLAAARGS